MASEPGGWGDTRRNAATPLPLGFDDRFDPGSQHNGHEEAGAWWARHRSHELCSTSLVVMNAERSTSETRARGGRRGSCCRASCLET